MPHRTVRRSWIRRATAASPSWRDRLPGCVHVRSEREATAAVPGRPAQCRLSFADGYVAASYFGVWAWVLRPTAIWAPGDFCAIGGAKLTFGADGDLVLYDERPDDAHARWSAGSGGPQDDRGGYATFQDDGNLVVYNRYGAIGRRSSTAGPGYLAIQSDGNVVIYDADWNPKWETGTAHKVRLFG